MKKISIFFLIIIFGGFLLSGCSSSNSESNNLANEMAVQEVVKEFSADMNILTDNKADNNSEVGFKWKKKEKIDVNYWGVNFQGLNSDNFKILADDLPEFPKKLEILNTDFDNNRVEIITRFSPEIQQRGKNIEFFVELEAEKFSRNWYIDSFKLRFEDPYEFEAVTLAELNNLNLKLPVSDYWKERSSLADIDLKIMSKYYNSTLREAYFHSSIQNNAAVLIDKGSLKNGFNLAEIEKQPSQKSEIEAISKELLDTIYTDLSGNDIKIDNYDEEKILSNQDTLIYEIDLDVELLKNTFNFSADRIYAEYELLVIYKVNENDFYLATYAAPDLLYKNDIEAELKKLKNN